MRGEGGHRLDFDGWDGEQRKCNGSEETSLVSCSRGKSTREGDVVVPPLSCELEEFCAYSEYFLLVERKGSLASS